MSRTPFLLLSAFALAAVCRAQRQESTLTLDSVPSARFEFSGPVGDRVQVNIENWLLPAPEANPGMLEMFRLRDRQPLPKLVPWAGEFVGKYLISAIQALRMSSDPRLESRVRGVVGDLISTQADDGYLGPFPKSERLLKHWDLWGHYHALLALTLWHEHSGDPAALGAARKAADLICATYLDTGRRVFDAGDHEMNMAILTGMAMLHRITKEPRYLGMAREVEKDWERAGDYLRAGLEGREFYRSPRPRWESLHDLQGLVELWRITGDSRYRQAFEQQWRSIRRWDRRNTGGFSSGEQATGNPYEPTPIETCCTVAWMALTVDYLRLTGDPAAADELELSTLNGGIGAQHPSGRWWTYNTPMDGVREASAHSIVFQSRAGTPELNCCSVNAPRVLGMLSEWALMSAGEATTLNWLGAGEYRVKLADGSAVKIASESDAWLTGRTVLRIDGSKEFHLRIRIPAWAATPVLKLNGAALAEVSAGTYYEIRRTWGKGDELEFTCALPVRPVAGARQTEGKVSLYRGPLLLAYDQAANAFDEAAIPPVDLKRLDQAVAQPARTPWVSVQVPTTGNQPLQLVDYASAGARGTRYRSWLAVNEAPAPPAFTTLPPDGGRVPPGPIQFRWMAGGRGSVDGYRIEFSADSSFARSSWSSESIEQRLSVESSKIAPPSARPQDRVYWRVIARGRTGETLPTVPAAWFTIDPQAPLQITPREPKLGSDREIIRHKLRGNDDPEFGVVESAHLTALGADGTELNGRDEMLVYSIDAWPEEDFSVSLRVYIKELPKNRIAQIFSAWTGVSDDPLRIVVDEGKLHARVEAGGTSSTPGVPVTEGRWYAVVAVKKGAILTLYLDGKPAGSTAVPPVTNTRSTACAIGGNPRFGGNEFLAARFSDFAFYARALSDQELAVAAAQK